MKIYIVTRFYNYSGLSPQTWAFTDEKKAREFYENLYSNLIYVANENLIIREIEIL